MGFKKKKDEKRDEKMLFIFLGFILVIAMGAASEGIAEHWKNNNDTNWIIDNVFPPNINITGELNVTGNTTLIGYASYNGSELCTPANKLCYDPLNASGNGTATYLARWYNTTFLDTAQVQDTGTYIITRRPTMLMPNVGSPAAGSTGAVYVDVGTGKLMIWEDFVVGDYMPIASELWVNQAINAALLWADMGNYIEPNGVQRVLIRAVNATTTPLMVKGFAAQSANLQEWQTSAGTVRAYVDADGDAQFQGALILKDSDGAGDASSTYVFGKDSADASRWILGNDGAADGDVDLLNYDSGSHILLRTTGGGFVVAGSGATGTKAPDGDIQVIDPIPVFGLKDSDSTGNASAGYVGYYDSAGTPTAYFGFETATNAHFAIQNHIATGGLKLKPASGGSVMVVPQAGSTSNLMEWQNSAGSVLSYVNSAGTFHAPDTGYKFVSDTDTGIERIGDNTIGVRLANVAYYSFNPTYIRSQSTGGFYLRRDDGAAATPTYAFQDDTNTGLWSPGAERLQLVTNSTAALSIDASQKIGIGDPTPDALVNIQGSNTGEELLMLQMPVGQTENAIEILNGSGNFVSGFNNKGFLNTANGVGNDQMIRMRSKDLVERFVVEADGDVRIEEGQLYLSKNPGATLYNAIIATNENYSTTGYMKVGSSGWVLGSAAVNNLILNFNSNAVQTFSTGNLITYSGGIDFRPAANSGDMSFSQGIGAGDAFELKAYNGAWYDWFRAPTITGAGNYVDVYIAENGGSVGIGNTAPNQTLDVSGNITSDYSFVDSIWHAFGGFQDKAVTIDLTQNVWANITNATGNLWTGLESDGISFVSDCMVFDNSADYVGSVSLTFSGLANTNYLLRVFEQNTTTQVGYYVGATGTGTNNYLTASLPIYIEGVAGYRYCLQVENTDNNNDITLRHSVFEIHYLHS